MKRFSIFLLFLLISVPAFAEYNHIDLTIYGMDWAICAHAVSVAMKKIDGVADAQVSLSKGMATIKLNPGNKVRFDQFRKAVESRGVTPKEATVKLRGQLEFDNERFRVTVPGTNESFEVAAIVSTPDKSEQALKQFIGQQLNFVVIIPPAEGKAQPAITIKDFWKWCSV